MEAAWEDRDADMSNLLKAALAADKQGRMTCWLLFDLAANAISANSKCDRYQPRGLASTSAALNVRI